MKAPAKVRHIALVHENTEYGTSYPASHLTLQGQRADIALTLPIPSNTTDVQSRCFKLKDKNPGLWTWEISYTSGAILYAKTMQDAGVNRRAGGRNARLLRSLLIKTVGHSWCRVLHRSFFAIGPSGSPPYLINDIVQKKEERRRGRRHGRSRATPDQ